MSEIQKQSIANVVVSLVGTALGYLYIGILSPYILTPDQLGLVSTLLAVGLITAHVAKLGGPYMTVRFYPFFKDKNEDKQSFLSFLLLITSAGFLLFTILYLVFQPAIVAIFKANSALFADYNKMAIPLVFFMSFFELFQAYSRVILRAVLPAVMREVVWRIVVIAALLCFHFKVIDFNLFIWIYSFAYAVPFLLMVIILAAKDEAKVSTNINLRGQFKHMIEYGQYVLLGSLATGTINEVDKVMISSLAGLAATGVYQVSAFFSIVIQIPARSVMMIAAPLVAVFIANNEMDKVERIYKKSSVTQLIAGLYIFAGIYINLANIFHILPPAYAAGKYVIIFIAISKLFDLATGINGEIILNSKYYRFDLFFNIALVVMVIGGDYFFIPRYGITGAAIASAGTIFLYNTAKSWFIWVVYRIQPFSKYTLYVLGIGLTVIVIDHFLPVQHNFIVDILFRSSIMSALYGILVFASGASEDVNNLARKWAAKLGINL